MVSPRRQSVASFDGAVPLWVSGLDDLALRRRLGDSTVERGAGYAREGAVLSLATGDRGRMLLATVHGSGRHDYQTLVTADPHDDAGPLHWVSRCSCPMQTDCKHVAAVLLTARQWLAGAHALPEWRSRLADLVAEIAPDPERAELGLQMELVTAKPTRYAGAAAGGSRVRLTPVTPGKAGGWIRTGVSWRDLELGYGRVEVGVAHREALLEVVRRHRASQPSWVSSYADVNVFLDTLGHSGWRALREAVDSGVALVPGGPKHRPGPPVRLAGGPASVLLDLRRAGDGHDAELGVVVRVPGEPDLTPDQVLVVGDPAHGVVVSDDHRMLLAGFERPLDPGVSALLTDEPVRIPADDLPSFLARYYPVLRQRVEVASLDGSVSFPVVQPPRLVVDVRFEPGHRTALMWTFGYPVDGSLAQVPIRGATGEVARDRAAEAQLLATLEVLDVVTGLRVGAAGERRLLADTVLVGLETASFVENVLPVLLARTDIDVRVEGSPVTYEHTDEAPLIAVSARDAADPEHADWFDLDVTVTVAGQDVPLATLLSAIGRGDEHLILDSGTWFALDRPELQALRRLIDEARAIQDRPGTQLRLTRWQAGLWDELVGLGVVDHQSERWTRTVGALLSLESVPKPGPPSGLLADLRPYQLEGYHWLCLLWDHQLGGILADDMGLGKTLQTLAMVARAHEMGTLTAPVLIVAPTSVVSTWAGEAARFCPQLRVAMVTETQARSGVPLAALDVEVVVTSYALLRIDEDAYRAQTWSGLVLDEAQFVKNHQAKTYQCARRVGAPFTLAITGTPLENSLMDLWSLLSITAPGLFPSPQRFTETYRKPIESGRSPEQLTTLRRRIRPWMLRRTKDQVARDLPPKIEQTLEVTLNPAHRRIYDQHLQRERQRVLGLIEDMDRNRIAILRSLTVLRQLSLAASLVDERHAGVRSSKIDALMEQLTEVVAEGHRVLVFSQFTSFLTLVRERLAADGIGHVYLDGRTRDRPARIAQFRDGDTPVFVISLKAGGFGLTLTEADYVFVLDPWWNPAAEAQAIDRTHRIGQDKTVMVYRLVANGTIEEKVVALQQRKRDLFTRVVDEGAMLGSQLSAQDIRGLFDP